MTKIITKVVCDAGPVLHLDELNCLDLLADFEEVILPVVVGNEIKKHRPEAFGRCQAEFSLISRESQIGHILSTICKMYSLDAGETEALAIMEEYPEAIFLTDDASARLAAQQMEYKVHGTIGILLRAIRRGQRQPKDVVQLLMEIPRESSLHIKPSLLSEIIGKIRTEYSL